MWRGCGEVPLEVRLGPSEVGDGFALGRLERRRGRVGSGHDLETLAAAAVGSLDRDRPAELLAERDDVVGRCEGFERAGDRGDVGFRRRDARRDLVAHDLDGRGWGPDPGDAALGDRPGEVGVLREEPVAGVDGVGAGAFDDVEDGVGVEVALGRGLAAECIGLVGVARVQRVSVELGVHRHGRDAELTARAHDADGDLTSVGDQDLRRHGSPGFGVTVAVSYGRCRKPGGAGAGRDVCSGSSGWPMSTRPTATPSRPPVPGSRDGLVVVADHQREGRGRLGRVWAAAPGSSLLLSVLLRPRRTVDELHLCTAAVALAMADAVRDVAGFTPALKWPNDLLADGRKLAGVLAEVDLGPSGVVRAVVIGVGINVTEHAFPPELASSATACDLVAGRSIDRRALLDAFLLHLEVRLDAPDAVLLGDYREQLATIGMSVRVDRPTGPIEGVAVAVDDLGGLVVETDDGELVTISAGDVVHLRAR